MIYSYLKLILTDRTGEVFRPLGGLDWHGCDGWGGVGLGYILGILYLDTPGHQERLHSYSWPTDI